MAGKGGRIPGAGRKPKGQEARYKLSARIDQATIQAIEAMAQTIGNRSAALDGIMDYLKVNNFEREVLPMGQNVPRVAELPTSMAFSSAAVRMLDRVMERLNLDSQEAAVDALCAFLRESGQIDALLEAMATREGS
jgi:hypothetical protein